MKPEHYPDLSRCEQLTKAGFPETENYWVYNSVEDYYAIQTKGFLHDFLHKQFGKNTTDGKEYVCPSVSELLDVIPTCIDNYVLEIQARDFGGYIIHYPSKVDGDFRSFKDFMTSDENLPNALSDLVLWLISQGYRLVDGTHADLLKVLGENWEIDGAYYLFNHVLKGRPDFPEPILLPENLLDLDLPEWKETCEILISLITK